MTETAQPQVALMSRPAPALALFVLVLNDHLLKGAGLLPAALTGKLSDLAGLFFFPILLTAALRLPPAAACALTGVVFSALKLDPTCNALANQWWGAVALDPTDLIALCMLPLALRWLTAAPHLPARRALELAAIMVAALASIATSAPPPPVFDQPRDYPSWQLVDGQPDVLIGCVQTHLWIARSGKQGVGIGVRAHNRCETPSALSMRAELLIAEDARMSAPKRHDLQALSFELPPGQVERRYIPVTFDSQRDWNDDRRVGVLSVRWDVRGDAAASLNQSLLLHHRRAAPHRVRKLMPDDSPYGRGPR